MKINEGLSYFAKILDKGKQEAHELQHLEVSLSDYDKLANINKELINVMFKFHVLAEELQQKYQAPLPEIDLKQVSSNNLIQKLRHFKGHGS